MMKLFTFDPKAIILSFLLFIGSCTGFHPPTPVEIKTPKSISSELIKENGLEIEIVKEQKIKMIFEDQDRKVFVLEINNNDIIKIKKGIQQAIDWKGNKDDLLVMIKNSTNAGSKEFELITEALRAKEIYKFKLISTPK